MNNDNKVLFVFGFIFYLIGELATTYIALSNGLTEKGLIRIITSTNFPTMVVMKLIFFIPLYLFIVYLEKRDNKYLCGAILGLVAGMGMTNLYHFWIILVFFG